MVERIRRATAADQATIGRLVRQARLNPRTLDWRAFVIAEADDKPVCAAQVRRHPGLFAAASHPLSWLLKSSGPVKARPGRNEVSR